jgi:hypothetical protein
MMPATHCPTHHAGDVPDISAVIRDAFAARYARHQGLTADCALAHGGPALVEVIADADLV